MDKHECTEKDTLKEMALSLTKIAVSQARTEENVVALDRRINGSLDRYQDHITQGKAWRMAVLGTAVGLILQVIAFAYIYGQLAKTVSVNERILQRMLSEKINIDIGENNG